MAVMDWYGTYYTYDETGTLVSFNYDSNVATSGDDAEYFYLRNLQGDIIAIIDSAGAIVVEYTYDAYGNILDTDVVSGYEEIAEHNSYTYRGYRRDQENGWYYLQSRYYVSETGRFLNDDYAVIPLFNSNEVFGSNLFTYGNNNPITNIDPYGYLSLGKNWWNKASNVALIIDLLIIFVPVFCALGGYIAQRKAAKLLPKVIRARTLEQIEKRSRKVLVELVVELNIKLAQQGYKSLGTVILAFSGAIIEGFFSLFNLTIGGIIVWILDGLDGDRDGYLWA